MHFEFDFTHGCSVKTKSAYGDRRLQILHTRNVHIQEVNSCDAPIATEWGGFSTYEQTRWYDGHHYMAVRTKLSASDLFDQMKRSSDFSAHDFNTGYFEDVKPGEKYLRIGDKKIEHYDADQYEDAVKSADEWASRCLIVDGVAYFRCFEPHYFIKTGVVYVSEDEILEASGHSHYAKPHTDKLGAHYLNGYHKRFSAHQLEAAHAASGTQDSLLDDIEIKVLLPEAMKFDMDRAALFEAGERFIISFNPLQIIDIRPESLVSISAVSEAIWKKNIDTFDSEALAEALRYGLDISAPEMENVGTSHFESIEGVLNRWDDREITIKLSNSPGM